MAEEFDGRFKTLRFSPWKRGRPEKLRACLTAVNSIDSEFDTTIYPNMDLSVEVKRAALLVSRSVVSVVSYTIGVDGVETRAFCGCGTILESEYIDDGRYVSTIITSGSVKRSSRDFSKKERRGPVIDTIKEVEITKIDVRTADSTLFLGTLFCYDPHFNIAVLKIESAVPMPKCSVRQLDDSISIDPNEDVKSASLRPLSDLFSIVPGELVIAVGRFWRNSGLMVAPGSFSMDYCDELDCEQLYKADCRITKCGVGGPLINCYGDVIGLNFYNTLYTPFLPINIVCKCLERFRTYGKFPHPKLGMLFTNLYAAKVDILERITRGFPNVCKGVIIEEVEEGSNADHTGIVEDDVIIAMDGNPLSGVLQLLELLLDKCGETVEFTIVRSRNVQLKLSMVINEASMEELNRWPLPHRYRVSVKRIRT